MNIVVPKPVNEVLTLLYDNSYEAYLVGGALRNIIMGIKPNTYDISTNATLAAVQKVLRTYKTTLKGQNNSVLSVINNKFPMEISKYRTKENTLESELATRDFTINALAYSDEDGLIDYNTGVSDIMNKILRLNSTNDEVFQIEPFRILRAIRLSAEYGMRVDVSTQEYMYEDKELLKKSTPERIRDELCKLLIVPRFDFYLKKYFDIFVIVIPELALLEGFNHNNPEHVYNVLDHTLLALKCCEPSLELRLACLLHDVAKPYTYSEDENGIGHFYGNAKKSSEIARSILNRLRFNKKLTQKVTKLIELLDTKIPENDEELKVLLAKYDPDIIIELMKLKKANAYAKNPAYISVISQFDQDFERIKNLSKKSNGIKRKDLNISGKDLLELGIPQEEIGKTIALIQSRIISGTLKNNRDRIITFVIETILETDKEETNIRKVA